jgi:hypothetical protein
MPYTQRYYAREAGAATFMPPDSQVANTTNPYQWESNVSEKRIRVQGYVTKRNTSAGREHARPVSLVGGAGFEPATLGL